MPAMDQIPTNESSSETQWRTQKRTVPLQAAVEGAVRRGYLSPPVELQDQPCGYFYDIAAYRRNMASLRDAFPGFWHHASAIKTNPLAGMLKIALADGHGAECASIGEVIHALKLGFAGPDVVFDCPCKSIPEIKHALNNKVMLNMDNMQELERVKQIVQTMPPEDLQGCVIGLRINPLVGSGKVANLSVSTRQSKFGVICPSSSADDLSKLANEGETSDKSEEIAELVAQEKERAAVVDALVENHFVNAIHVHTGSGGMSVEQMAEGAVSAAQVALEVNAKRGAAAPQIDVIDIGGGLPVAWGNPEGDPSFQDYSDAIRARCPELFDGKTFRRVVTEMGSSMNTRYAFFASICEVTKPTDGGQIAMIHCGSDQFMRASYAAHMRAPYPVSVFCGDGRPKCGNEMVHDIVGPLCFAGDVVTRQAMLPMIEVGDLIVLEEAGGNTHSLRTTHCSRRSPPVYGYEEDPDGEQCKDGLKFTTLSQGSTYDQVLSNWE